jgi:hypothetical protein
VTSRPRKLDRVWAMERQDRNAPLFWAGEEVWHGLDVPKQSRGIRRFHTPEDAQRAYDRYYAGRGGRKPPADPIDVGPAPGLLCECGKMRFPNRVAAERTLVTLWRRRSHRRQERRAYECEMAPGTWHLTKLEKIDGDGDVGEPS